ncbi:hypothetical protein MAM1_0023d01937 [Mucor ambiguus]|uniref:Uncharacterized protein n=1 Tax=Mucor ambiguus TaxID=91626 RepID=A0A0C9MKV4_9FUNG|nr:hypothetical protein MAM1_0023d01937 [Mucor ambiguus]
MCIFSRFVYVTEGPLEWFTVHNVSTAFFKRKSTASTIQSTVAIEAAIEVPGHVYMPLNISTNVSFKNENEGDSVDSDADDNGAANAVKVKVINGHAEQEAIDQMMLPYL